MSTHDHSHHSRSAPSAGSFWSSRAFLVFLGFAAVMNAVGGALF
jgi:hypothetical protein